MVYLYSLHKILFAFFITLTYALPQLSISTFSYFLFFFAIILFFLLLSTTFSSLSWYPFYKTFISSSLLSFITCPICFCKIWLVLFSNYIQNHICVHVVRAGLTLPPPPLCHLSNSNRSWDRYKIQAESIWEKSSLSFKVS